MIIEIIREMIETYKFFGDGLFSIGLSVLLAFAVIGFCLWFIYMTFKSIFNLTKKTVLFLIRWGKNKFRISINIDWKSIWYTSGQDCLIGLGIFLLIMSVFYTVACTIGGVAIRILY